MVNLLAHAKPQPMLRVGLISYGNDGYDAKAGWVRKDAELTTEPRRRLRTSCSRCAPTAARSMSRARSTTRPADMKWDQDQGTLKIIFVAGNEPANQDPQIPVERALGEARQKGIFVNAIYCGGDGAYEAAGWRQVASLGAGKYAAIDQNRVVAINTPMDGELAKLSSELNKTYVGYGVVAREKAANQAAMDAASDSAGAPVAASRAAAKASALYRNDEWDLVDARAHGKKDVGPHEGRGAARADAAHERGRARQVPRRQGARARRAAEADRRSYRRSATSSSRRSGRSRRRGPRRSMMR